jgi:hypothetical protein
VLVDDPQQLYRQSSDALRRQLNLTFHERLYVEDESISDRELNWPFTELFEASGRYQRLRPQDLIKVDTHMRPGQAGAHVETNADLLATVLSAGGSSKTALVGLLQRYSRHPARDRSITDASTFGRRRNRVRVTTQRRNALVIRMLWFGVLV